MKRTFAFLAFALLTSGVVAAQDGGTITITSSPKIAADKMKLDAETFYRMQEPQGMFMSSAPVKGAPFTAQQISESTGTLRDGTHISKSTTVAFARDSEGRTRRETDNSITIMDPVANVSYMLDKKTHTVVKLDLKIGLMQKGFTYTMDASPTMRDDLKDKATAEIKLKEMQDTSTRAIYQRSSSLNTSEESLGAQVMEGVSAIGKRITMTYPVNPDMGNDQPIKIVQEQWYSPELQINIVSRNDDPRRTTQTSERYTNIKRSDPDPSLFQVPADYTLATKRTDR